MPTLMPQSVGGLIGVVLSFVLGATLLYLRFRKEGVDQSVLLMKQWKELQEVTETGFKQRIDNLERRLKSAEDREAALQDQVTALQARITILEEVKASLSERNIRLNEENAGLRRQLAQVAASAGSVYVPPNADFDELLERELPRRRARGPNREGE